MSSKYRANLPYYATPETGNKNSLKTFINAGAVFSGLQVEHMQLPGKVRHLLCPWVPLDGWWQENNGICCGVNLGSSYKPVYSTALLGDLSEKVCTVDPGSKKSGLTALLLNVKDHWPSCAPAIISHEHFVRHYFIIISYSFYSSQQMFMDIWKWQPTPVLLPGEFHGLRSLVGYSPRDHKESHTIEWFSLFHCPCDMAVSWGSSISNVSRQKSYVKDLLKRSLSLNLKYSDYKDCGVVRNLILALRDNEDVDGQRTTLRYLWRFILCLP